MLRQVLLLAAGAVMAAEGGGLRAAVAYSEDDAKLAAVLCGMSYIDRPGWCSPSPLAGRTSVEHVLSATLQRVRSSHFRVFGFVACVAPVAPMPWPFTNRIFGHRLAAATCAGGCVGRFSPHRFRRRHDSETHDVYVVFRSQHDAQEVTSDKFRMRLDQWKLSQGVEASIKVSGVRCCGRRLMQLTRRDHRWRTASRRC